MVDVERQRFSRVSNYRKSLYKYPLSQLKNYHIRSYLEVLYKITKEKSLFVAIYKDPTDSNFHMHISDREDIVEDMGTHTLIVYQGLLDIIRDQRQEKLDTYLNMICNLFLIDVEENHSVSRKKTIIFYKEDLDKVLKSNRVGYDYIVNPYASDSLV